MNSFETLKNTAELFKRKDLTASLERGEKIFEDTIPAKLF